MSLDLIRVDDRLIHGQVVVGWGYQINPDLFVIVNDEVAANDWEQELYSMGVPETADVEFKTVDDAAQSIDEWANSSRRTVVLVSDVASLTRLCDGASTIRRVNLGGIHHEGSRRHCLPYLFLDDAEVDQLRSLAARGLEITAQDLPNAAPVTLAELIQ